MTLAVYSLLLFSVTVIELTVAPCAPGAMTKPEPNDAPSRFTGAPCPPMPMPPNRSPKGVPENGLATMSAKLIGAPERGTLAWMAPGSFWACWATLGCSASVAVAPPRRSALVMA
ncbi:hypothetical protein WR25_08057 [Diploscapter pachys]|uniref:Secreted protein n=1 Tax=Diploscapter pachys TaxID=2018661 RepID=A0A2A2K2Q5_9BILA|nr:hypothetical protein WR25_08057 [Diploscapter pachys]